MNADTLIAALCGAGVAAGLVLMLRGLIGTPADQVESAGTQLAVFLEKAKAPGTTRKVLASVAAGAAVGAFTGWPVGALLAAVGAWVLPSMFGKDRGAAREQARIEAIATWTEMARDTLTAAAGLEQAIMATALSAPAAIREEVAELAANLRAGARLDDALKSFGMQLADPTGDLVVASLILASRHQARNLTEVLSALAANAREQVALRMRTSANRQRTRTSVRVIVSVVLGLGGGLVLLDRSYMAPYDSALGQVVLLAVAGLFAVAFAWMNKISAGKKPPRFLTRLDAPADEAWRQP